MGCGRWLWIKKNRSRRRDCTCKSCHLLDGLDFNAFLFSLAKLLTLYFLLLPISVHQEPPWSDYLVKDSHKKLLLCIVKNSIRFAVFWSSSNIFMSPLLVKLRWLAPTTISLIYSVKPSISQECLGCWYSNEEVLAEAITFITKCLRHILNMTFLAYVFTSYSDLL